MSATHPLAEKACLFINEFQGGFPISDRPFLQVAAKLGMTESALIRLVEELLQQGYLSRFGPLFDVARMGGCQILAAMSVPESRFEEVAAIVNGLDEVAHNYRREHRLNMWFVIAAESLAGVSAAADAIESKTGLEVLRLPKLREFYVGLFLHLRPGDFTDTTSTDALSQPGEYCPDPLDRPLVVACQRGLPIVATPYAAVAEGLGVGEHAVRQRFRYLLQCGVIRRIGAVPNHYRLGLRANGMTVWDIADDPGIRLGQVVGNLPFVSHCYLRPRISTLWPYNLFAMVHGHDRPAVENKRGKIRELLGKHSRSDDILYSSQILKKTGLKLAA